MEPSSSSSSSDDGKLFIGGVGWDTTEDRLKDHFGRYGDVEHAMIMRDKLTGHSRGFGFVVFSDPSVIPSVLQQTHTIDGRTIDAKRAMSKEQQQSLRSGSTRDGGNSGGSEYFKTKKIFVGGLPSTLTEDEFKEYFQEYGDLTDVVIMYDPNTGRPRGFGFITFTTEEAVDTVLKKTFHELNGKKVEVKRALPKDVANGTGTRGGSYRGDGNSYISGGRSFNAQMGNNRFMQSPIPIGGGYVPYSGYGGFNYGYVGNGSPGYSTFGGYGSFNAGYIGPAGVYGNLGSVSSNFLKNPWLAGYNQAAGYGAYVPWNNASRSSASGYTPVARLPGGDSRYVHNKGHDSNGYAGAETSNGYSGGDGANRHDNGSGSYNGRMYDNSNGSSRNADHAN